MKVINTERDEFERGASEKSFELNEKSASWSNVIHISENK